MEGDADVFLDLVSMAQAPAVAPNVAMHAAESAHETPVVAMDAADSAHEESDLELVVAIDAARPERERKYAQRS